VRSIQMTCCQLLQVVRKAQDVLNIKGKAAAGSGSEGGPRTHDATVVSSSSTTSIPPPLGAPAAQDASTASQSAIPLGAGTPPTPSPPASSATPAAGSTSAPGGPAGAPFMQLLMSDPSLAPKLANPKVHAVYVCCCQCTVLVALVWLLDRRIADMQWRCYTMHSP
jgi:hypothetical protein